MGSLILIPFLVVWIYVIIKINSWVGKQFKSLLWKFIVQLTLFIALLALPVADEIIGGRQLAELCKPENIGLKIDAEKIRGKAVIATSDHAVHIDAAIPITEQTFKYIDPVSREVLASYKGYSARGGWFIRMIGSETGNPITMGRSGCDGIALGTGTRNIRKEFNFTISNI
jgi:hypothetical protein